MMLIEVMLNRVQNDLVEVNFPLLRYIKCVLSRASNRTYLTRCQFDCKVSQFLDKYSENIFALYSSRLQSLIAVCTGEFRLRLDNTDL